MSSASLSSFGSRNSPCADETEDDEVILPKSSQGSTKRISFPVDSILNAVIQEGDINELLRILRHQRAEIDLNQKNHVGLTALHHAVLTNNLDSVKLLLNYGADVSAQDIYGFSPLHTSAALGFLQMTTLLIVCGADVFSKTKQSELPIDLAKDIAVIRVLSHEMCLKVHTETFIKSFAKVKAVHLIQCLYIFMLYLYRTLSFILKSIKYKYTNYKRIQQKRTVQNGSRSIPSNEPNNEHSLTNPDESVDKMYAKKVS